MPLTAAEKRRRIRAGKAKIHPDAKTGRTMASAARSAKYLKLQAGRAATARRLSGQKATTQAQLDARKGVKPPVKGETKPERTGRWARELPIIGPGIAALQDVLSGKPKKKKED